ncbi:type II pantothenate kinase [Lentibacillus salinarum]|uniref:Type II pantothenate kinase n=1 Tax=Lentibacillus salinarum TaxID=446820 RepID=A0ABW3ZTR7_9BACI
MTQTKIGIDAGGTLIKTAYIENERIQYRSFPSQAIDDAIKWLHDYFEKPAICVTGGRSQVLAKKLNVPAKTVVEFDATTEGITYLAGPQTLGRQFLFVNVGTGTSIHHVTDGRQERIGGSGIGGGTLLGLAYLTTGMQDYEEIVRAASDGNREHVDLKVKDIFEGLLPPISGDLTASNFGKAEWMREHKPSDSDMLAAIIGLIGEVIVTISTQAAAQYDTGAIVYIGSSFRSNPLLQDILVAYTRLVGKEPVFLPNGEYSGAIGALLAID